LRMKDCDAAATLVPQCLADLRLNAIIWCMRSKRCDGVLVGVAGSCSRNRRASPGAMRVVHHDPEHCAPVAELVDFENRHEAVGECPMLPTWAGPSVSD
jgi:hypothetical protein